MPRSLTLLAALFVALAAYLLIRSHFNDSNLLDKGLPPSELPGNQDTSNFHEWREFSFKPDHFKVLLPGLPQHVSDRIHDTKTNSTRKYETFASAGNNGAAFMVNAVSFTDGSQADGEGLKSLVNDMLARNKENRLVQMKKSTFRGAPALDFTFSNDDLLIEGKIFAHENTAYIVSMINKKNIFNQKEWEFFLNSFDFVEDSQPQEAPQR